jgi:hypothetical protein
MVISRAKSFGELYDMASDNSLILTPEPSLADALCCRLDRHHFGHFATTPRRLAAHRREPREDRTAFHRVVTETDLEWTAASYATGNVLQCWEYDGQPESVLEYPRFDDHVHRTAVDVLRECDTTSRALTEYEIRSEEYADGVAVIGPELLSPLEQSILPEDCTTIDPLQNESHDLEPFRIMDSSAAIVDALVDAIDAENAEDVAIVLDSHGQYSALVESAFEANDIPFYGGPNFIDRNHHRAFLQLLRLLHSGSDLRVSDARPLYIELDVDVPITHDEKRLHAVEDESLRWLQELHRDPAGVTVGALVDAVDSRTHGDLEKLRTELATLGIVHEPVTQSVADQLLFYFQRYDVPVDRENRGVLLADANSSAYVDRPLVFYLGLDESWTHTSPRRPWVDPEAEYERNIQTFQILLQNGHEQYYLVQDTAGGDPVSPTIYLEDLIDHEFERFSDLNHVPHTRSTLATGDGFSHEERDVDCEQTEAISQSNLNSYVNSPRDYFFAQLLESPDQDYFREGTWFHDFAEVYATHPDRIEQADIETVVDAMERAVTSFLESSKTELRRTTYRLGLQQISWYLDQHPPIDTAGVADWKPYAGNVVAELLDLEVDGPHTEVWFRDADLGIKGSIDLRRSDRELVDYKKGSKKRPRSIVSNAARDPPGDTPDYQAIMYLARQRQINPEAALDFTFVHFLETLEERLTDDEPALDDCLSTVSYRPVTFAKYIKDESVYTFLREDHWNDCNDTFQAVSYETYRDIVESGEPPNTQDSDEMVQSEFGENFVDQMKTAVEQTPDGDSINADKGARQALKHFASINAENFFRPDIDDFEKFVGDRLLELNRRRRGDERFPITHLKEEPNERRLNHRDLLLEGDP